MVPDLLTSVAFWRPTKLIWVWDLSYLQLTYNNYNLAKWLEEKLKPLSINEYTITDAFSFSEEIHVLSLDEDDILVSYDVTALFTRQSKFWSTKLLPMIGSTKPMI